jgi:formamidopyrimidine-DNA glycosylase
MFGGLSVSEGGAELPPEIAHIARDPFDPEFDDDLFVGRVRRRTAGIKRLLLDQNLISGVGNIYADEALWRAELHGERPGERLRPVQVRRVLAEARAVMGAALGRGGTSFDALYVNINGESGYFDRSLHAYGREGLPCERCGTPIRRAEFMNRSSFFCPRCQPVPRARRVPVRDGPRPTEVSLLKTAPSNLAGPPRRKASIHGQGSDRPSAARPRPPPQAGRRQRPAASQGR